MTWRHPWVFNLYSRYLKSNTELVYFDFLVTSNFLQAERKRLLLNKELTVRQYSQMCNSHGISIKWLDKMNSLPPRQEQPQFTHRRVLKSAFFMWKIHSWYETKRKSIYNGRESINISCEVAKKKEKVAWKVMKLAPKWHYIHRGCFCGKSKL